MYCARHALDGLPIFYAGICMTRASTGTNQVADNWPRVKSGDTDNSHSAKLPFGNGRPDTTWSRTATARWTPQGHVYPCEEPPKPVGKGRRGHRITFDP